MDFKNFNKKEVPLAGEKVKVTDIKIPEKVQEKTVLESLDKRIKEARQAEGFFITITQKNGKILTHTDIQYKFPTEDIIPSLKAILKMKGLLFET